MNNFDLGKELRRYLRDPGIWFLLVMLGSTMLNKLVTDVAGPSALRGVTGIVLEVTELVGAIGILGLAVRRTMRAWMQGR